MKKFYFAFILMLLAGTVVAQKTKKIKNKTYKPPSKEIYFVLKSDMEVKQGKYVKEFNGEKLKKGQYTNGERTGIWEFYNLRGKVIHKVDYDKMEVILDESPNGAPILYLEKYSRPLIVLGGMESTYYQIAHLLKYPAEALQNKTQGRVYVKLLFDSTGSLEKTEVVEGLGNGLDEEALRVINLIDIETIPGLDKDGKPASSEIIFPIIFRIS